MKLGISIRNMGPQSSRSIMTDCAVAADKAGLDSLWITEHIAIPPDDAVGSGGRYLDPLITLAYLAAKTEQIKLGTGVLILPYRPPLVTAKLVATLQELSEGRVKLGVGIGWMRSEFKALGLDLRKRVSDSERVLSFLHEAFENHIVSQNDQPFIFDPRPSRPTILMGGAAPHAIGRAVRLADGWMPMGLKPEILAPLVRDYQEQAATAGKPEPEIVVLSGLPLANVQQCEDRISAYREAGATTLIHGQRYEESSELIESIGRLSELPSS
jgi:probable F420-dependent oxidoreductase